MGATPTPELRLDGLTKRFGRVDVLRNVDLVVEPGEFVGLMGPNGAGKSTLLKILDGVHEATSGTISLNGEPVAHLGGRADVGFVHQDLGLVESMTVLENLRLGERPLRVAGPFLDRRAERRDALSALARVGLEHAVDEPVAALAPGEQALVAVGRAFARGARILFIDEATSTLPPQDAKRVIAALRENAAMGATIVMVTHKLHEILDATRRVVVLLDGRLAVDEQTEGMDRARLVAVLLQHEAERAGRSVNGAAAPGETLLELRDVWGGRAGPVDLALRAGEVVGLTGLPGSGLHDVAFLAHGSQRPSRGAVTRADGVRTALVPPYRETQGGFAELDVLENMTIASLGRWRTAVRTLARGRERREGAATAARLKVKPAGTESVALACLVAYAALARVVPPGDDARRSGAIRAGIVVVGLVVLGVAVDLPKVVDDSSWLVATILTVGAALYLTLELTTFGRYLRASGANRGAARLAGVQVQREVMKAFLIGGVLAALARIVLGASQGSAAPNVASTFLLPAFAAAFLSTVVFSTGRFTVWGTIIGGVFVIWISQGLIVGGIAPQWTDVVNGAVLVAAVSLSSLLKRIRA